MLNSCLNNRKEMNYFIKSEGKKDFFLHYNVYNVLYIIIIVAFKKLNQ